MKFFYLQNVWGQICLWNRWGRWGHHWGYWGHHWGHGCLKFMEVTLLSVEVTCLQKSKSLRVVPHRFFSHWIQFQHQCGFNNGCHSVTEWTCHLLSCLGTAKKRIFQWTWVLRSIFGAVDFGCSRRTIVMFLIAKMPNWEKKTTFWKLITKPKIAISCGCAPQVSILRFLFKLFSGQV